MPRESKENQRKRAAKLLAQLREMYFDATCELDFEDPFELLIATILSAQTTDKAVNQVTPALFAKYPNARKLADADPQDVEPLISSIGLFRNKSKSIVGAARKIVDRFGGEVPGNREDLESLPGVGRKTANVVLPNAFGVPGLAVDTHVKRLSARLGLTRHTDPLKIEKDLTSLYKSEDWHFVSHALIWHGRRVCDARKPQCDRCRIHDLCPSAGKFSSARAAASTKRRSSASRGRRA